jgi:hypothetical protein
MFKKLVIGCNMMYITGSVNVASAGINDSMASPPSFGSARWHLVAVEGASASPPG